MSPDRDEPESVWQRRLDELVKQLEAASTTIHARLADATYHFQANERDALTLMLEVVEVWQLYGLDVAREHRGEPAPMAGTPAGEAMSALVMLGNWARSWAIDALPPGDARVDDALRTVETLTSSLRSILRTSSAEDHGAAEALIFRTVQSRLELFEAKWAALSAQRAVARVRAVEATVEAAAGVVGEGLLAKAFSAYSANQGWRSIFWLAVTVLLLVAVVVIGVALLQDPASRSWQEVLAHLLVAVPAVGLAPYAARESSRRREEAARARLLRTQLQTIDAYRAQLNNEHAESLLYDFGRYVYGPYVRPGDNAINALPTDAVDVVASLIKKQLPGT